MTITLPDGVAERIQGIAKRNGYESVAEFLMNLVEETEAEAEALAALPGPPSVTPRNRAELEAMLEAGVNSGPTVRMTEEFWEERRRALEERQHART